MENENINTENKAPSVGRNGRAGLAALLLKSQQRPAEKEGEPGNTTRAGESPGESAEISIGITDDSTTTPGSVKPGEEIDDVEFYEFSGTKYTPEQVESALRELETNQWRRWLTL